MTLPPASADVIRPNPGPQEAFLASPADIAIFGGAAGGSKTWGLLMEAFRHAHRPGFAAVIFRRTYPEIMNPGGLWTSASDLYARLGGTPHLSDCSWSFPGGGKVKFAYMQYETDKYNWQGTALPFLGFDEITHFSRSMFFYMLSRNRLGSSLGMRPYIRGTCNPDPDSWLAEFIGWWLDEETGLPIPERSGVIRWLLMDGDTPRWGSSKEELLPICVPGQEPKSVTFIPARITDNPQLLKNDPGYLANLHTLALVDRSRLLDGNWKTRPTGGMFFKRHWFEIVAEAPAGGSDCRYWDRAATEPTRESPDPDWTAGVKARLVNGVFYILDVRRDRLRPQGVKRLITTTASEDGQGVEIGLEQDPGQAGVAEVEDMIRALPGYIAKAHSVHDSKAVRAKPASSSAEAGNIKLVRGPWNKAFLDEVEAFADWDHLPASVVPVKKPKRDQVDALSGVHNVLSSQPQYRVRSLA